MIRCLELARVIEMSKGMGTCIRATILGSMILFMPSLALAGHSGNHGVGGFYDGSNMHNAGAGSFLPQNEVKIEITGIGTAHPSKNVHVNVDGREANLSSRRAHNIPEGSNGFGAPKANYEPNANPQGFYNSTNLIDPINLSDPTNPNAPSYSTDLVNTSGFHMPNENQSRFYK